MRLIHIAAALLIGADGRTLLVRKRGTQAFMQPGGKIESGEPAVMALIRELEEELGLQVDSDTPEYLGSFAALAANEPSFEVRCELFEVRIEGEVSPAAEIEEVLWITQDSHPDLNLAPLTRDTILPIYRKLALAV
jgi:8-oxo-dGTP pyrophosphatase MutT (NUDIX family)